MSYAVETKKRKFHRVLESLTKPTTADSAPKPTTGTPATPREPIPVSQSIKKVRLSGDESNLTSVRNSILKVAKPGTRVASSSSTARPSFVPWDRERFLERLETFRRVDRWSPKPSAISEVEWAKRGWICTDVTRVTCVGGCGGSVVVKLPDELDELDGYDIEKVQERKEVRAKLVEEYARLLIEGHGESCPWKNKGCDATIHRLALSNPDMAISGLQKRYSNLEKMGDKLPRKEAIQAPESIDIEEIIKILPAAGFQQSEENTETTESDTHQQPTESEGPEKPTETTEADTAQTNGEKQESTTQTSPAAVEINRAAFALALFGWDAIMDGTAGLAGCGACFRRLGLWMYKSKEDGGSAVYDALEVATEHMEYCPWINGQAQSGTGKSTEKREDLRSGSDVLSQALKVKHRRRIRSTASMDTLRADSEAPSVDGPIVDEDNDEAKKATNREWWSKLRRMRQVLNVKSPNKRKSVAS
ncbi:hypothetical protein ASPWEDRAFT_177137 [Aspergillus wentii DTO 134E9]|uniref:C3HC-type domain-containing protein n=1 Tax=Aspergillus wentii DTO 134E9 TaxID=1073089 RepID=A0A1L9R6D5_ASPWE|nr:uncharacterized protein ASPWEDRAFT_177137 [Aspergillus wentii DTO 134E9]KAI9926849.1 hypothetical protein MW887_003946 [Aspergillus wentii]OJJ30481.1 hypothetical protein ASPWEDRAFT_177137 [Aspergillus wentii DTO 134E9]